MGLAMIPSIIGILIINKTDISIIRISIIYFDFLASDFLFINYRDFDFRMKH